MLIDKKRVAKAPKNDVRHAEPAPAAAVSYWRTEAFRAGGDVAFSLDFKASAK